ncbi:MAG: hypothetical protein PHW63_08030 [Alphaproteobacteria bacterium]|nr:hypothetical protein [Alphaproteobacteria bacterium]
MLHDILVKLSIAAPIIWFAFFVSKLRSETQRLQQEYAHKTALSQSYMSFKKQITELKDQDDELIKKLLDATIDTVSYNASQTLDGKHGDKLPIQNLAEKIVDKATNIGEKLLEKCIIPSETK